MKKYIWINAINPFSSEASALIEIDQNLVGLIGELIQMMSHPKVTESHALLDSPRFVSDTDLMGPTQSELAEDYLRKGNQQNKRQFAMCDSIPNGVVFYQQFSSSKIIVEKFISVLNGTYSHYLKFEIGPITTMKIDVREFLNVI